MRHHFVFLSAADKKQLIYLCGTDIFTWILFLTVQVFVCDDYDIMVHTDMFVIFLHGWHICIYSDGEVDVPVRRRDHKRGTLRHAFSEVLPNEDPRRRSQTMTEAKEYAYNRLQQELNIAQSVSNCSLV